MISTLIDKWAKHLRFTIFDYATRKFTYEGTYMELDGLSRVSEMNGKQTITHNWNAFALLRLSKSSLDIIPFERTPFRDHIASLQSIINANKEEEIDIG